MDFSEKKEFLHEVISFGEKVESFMKMIEKTGLNSVDLDTSVRTLKRQLNIVLRILTEYAEKRKLLMEYLGEIQKELDAHVEFNCVENYYTELYWYYDKDNQLKFDILEHSWLKVGDKYIYESSYESVKRRAETYDNFSIVPVTPKSVLLKRKEWLLKQIAQLEK
jgi:hypothetical protein